ncbi:MAG: response regulator [Janthinobacterium lividum]
MSVSVCVPTGVPAASRTETVPDDAKAAMRVVVIDDNQDSASALALLVELWGYDVRVGYDGYTALELAQGFHPHAVLLDIGLPGFNGYDTACCIRQAETHARSEPALLVAVTGYGSPRDVARAMRSGFDHHLVKPSDPDVLERFLRNRACYLSTHRLAYDAQHHGAPSTGGTLRDDVPMAVFKPLNI